MPSRFSLWARVAVWSLFSIPCANAANNACPDRPVRSITSTTMPVDVCVPDGFIDVPVNYFDDFAWRAFLAPVFCSSGMTSAPKAGSSSVKFRKVHRIMSTPTAS